jgi:hypothetical protein
MADVLMAQDNSLIGFNQSRQKINKIGMLTLGGWAVGNIITGAVMRSRTEGITQKFHEMNIYWNTFNLGLAGAGLYSALRSPTDGLSVYGSWQEQSSIEKTLLFNAGLDVGYILGGLYLNERGKNTEKNSELLQGFGRSVILQGGFLMAFDLTMYFIHRHNAGKHKALFENIQLSLAPDGFGMVMQF